MRITTIEICMYTYNFYMYSYIYLYIYYTYYDMCMLECVCVCVRQGKIFMRHLYPKRVLKIIL